MAADPDCLFCKIVAGEVPSTRVREDERTIAFMDINPATRGHLLVIPREHATDLRDIGAEDLNACLAVGQALARTMEEKLGADGVNLLNSCGRAAWQTVFHFHLHVIPRYDNDPLRLPVAPGSRATATRSPRRRTTSTADMRRAAVVLLVLAGALAAPAVGAVPGVRQGLGDRRPRGARRRARRARPRRSRAGCAAR